MPVASLNDIKKLLRNNPNLEEVTLVNVKLTSSCLDQMLKLPKIKYVKVSPDICPGVKFTDAMEQLEKKGCKVDYHYDYY